jgi:tetratricopeptide (TPR) repeat protein
LANLTTALELNPDEPQAHFIRGWLFARAGQFEPAAEDLARFLELSGDQNEDAADFRDACAVLATDEPLDENGEALDSPEKVDLFLGRRGWSFDYSKNDDYEEQGLPCPYAHCIRNRPPLSPEVLEGCPVFGYACPGMGEQTTWCREHPPLFE